MKKLLGCLLLVTMVMSACEGPMGPPGRDGLDGRNGKDGKDAVSTQWFIQDCVIFSEDWKPVTDDLMGDIFEYGFNIPKLSTLVFEEGAVVCYLLQKVGKSDIQTPLPYTFYGRDGDYFYSENYTCEVRPGYINFIVKVSDFNTKIQQPLDCKFRVVLMW